MNAGGIMSLSIYQQIIVDAFNSKNWNFTYKNFSAKESGFLIDFISEKSEEMRCIVKIFDDGVCEIKVILPMVCQKEQYGEMSVYLMVYNLLLTFIFVSKC